MQIHVSLVPMVSSQLSQPMPSLFSKGGEFYNVKRENKTHFWFLDFQKHCPQRGPEKNSRRL